MAYVCRLYDLSVTDLSEKYHQLLPENGLKVIVLGWVGCVDSPYSASSVTGASVVIRVIMKVDVQGLGRRFCERKFS